MRHLPDPNLTRRESSPRSPGRRHAKRCGCCNGDPLGVQRIAGLLGVPAATLERFHEPYLMRLGLIALVRGGRVAA